MELGGVCSRRVWGPSLPLDFGQLCSNTPIASGTYLVLFYIKEHAGYRKKTSHGVKVQKLSL